jgi:hypothetical protein
MFVGLHVVMAERTNVPELDMGMDEGERFFTAAQNVLRHYSVETTQKTIDWLAFVGVTATMYGGRFASYVTRKKEERVARVYPLHRQPAPQAAQAPQPQQSGGSDYIPSVVPGEDFG